MSSFESTRNIFTQEHFTIIEIDLPVVNGECTISGEPGYGTPLSCDQPTNGIKTYKFTDYGGVLQEAEIHKVIKGISESPTELKLGTGLAERGSLTISLIDKPGDPNLQAPAVTQQVADQSTFFSKMDKRYILTNNVCRRKDYRVQEDGSIDLLGGALVSHWIIGTFTSGKNSTWTLKLKDELSKTNLGESVWPLAQEGFLRFSINDIETVFSVDPIIDYKIGDTIRLGDELCKITAISNIQTALAEITVQARGSDIVYTNTLSKTVRESHSLGDEIFVCGVADNERSDDLLKRILEDVGIDSSLIPIADWNTEIDDWSITNLNTLFVESVTTSEVLNSILVPRQLNQWFDPFDRQVKLSAINAWKVSSFVIEEGESITDNAIIDYNSVTKKKEENIRATRALITYDKPFLTSGDDFANFKKLSIAKRTSLETTDFFGVEPKIKQFKSSFNIDKVTADLLTSRYIQRNSNPYSLVWTTQEKKLNFKVGDVGDIKTSQVVDFSGASSVTSRGQIISIRPINTPYGREYLCKGLIYEPALESGSEIIITESVTNLNLYVLAGAPSADVEITFIFDSAISMSTLSTTPAIRAGGFSLGSKIIIILADGSDLQAKGGDGGDGASVALESPDPPHLVRAPQNGIKGGTVYDAEGIDTDIYFSGTTPSGSFPIAEGAIRAPGGGAGGFDFINDGEGNVVSGNGGGGGAGMSQGLGGLPGDDIGAEVKDGIGGKNGSEDGAGGVFGGGDFGEDGSNNNAVGGAKGNGVIDNGATVTFFGDTPVNYINGGGDH